MSNLVGPYNLPNSAVIGKEEIFIENDSPNNYDEMTGEYKENKELEIKIQNE